MNSWEYQTYNVTSPTIVRISLADAFFVVVPVTPRTPAFVHHNFLNEAEIYILLIIKSCLLYTSDAADE